MGQVRDPALHCYTNGTDWVVARDVDDAWNVWCDYKCMTRDEADLNMVWRQVPDDERIAIAVDSDGDIVAYDDAFDMLERTAAEWAAHEGPGFLCKEE
jgi:hypothetical protein